ncbi:MAG: hypothetical protein IJ529_04770 [Alphaproteobacteria bacterium]|nr:hypothetical protein [Alphaproteobacteria bacterium]MBQ9236165.1 hypothetical protein [Alphaproteobacteria bacterium]
MTIASLEKKPLFPALLIKPEAKGFFVVTVPCDDETPDFSAVHTAEKGVTGQERRLRGDKKGGVRSGVTGWEKTLDSAIV